MFTSSLFLQKVYEVALLRLDNPLCVEAFCLLKESRKSFSVAPLFYFFQNPIVHQVALTFGDHTMDIEYRISNSLSFLFGQILVKTI
jgi:hypothetical protein